MRQFVFLLASCVALASGCKSPYYADRGAALGGVTGALAGAAIGENNGNAAAGAIFGSALGAMTGAAIGDSIDADIARNQAIVEERMGRQMMGAVGIPDVIAMSQAGLSDDVITTHIRANGTTGPLVSADLITLKQNGVSDAVINTMQSPPPVTRAAPASRPVVVEEHHYVVPSRPYHHHWHYARPRHRGHRGVHWGVSFSN